MKITKFLSILLVCTVFSFYSCKEDASALKQQARESVEVPVSTTQTNPATPNPPTTEPAQNADGVWHYTCSNGCAGGAGAKGNCATCGSPLAHNAAYHPPVNSTPTTTQINPPTTPPVTPPTTSPAQNAAGVWHYTCGNGCAGGAGAKGNCSTCGGALAHNAAYHQ